MSDFQPETVDTGSAEVMGQGGNETAEQMSEAGAEPEKPSKKWAGKFESPEDLERDYFRSNQERNELKDRLDQYEKVVLQQQYAQQPQESEKDRIFKQKFAESFQRNKFVHGDVYDDERIKYIAAIEANRETEHDLQMAELRESLRNELAWGINPKRQIINQIASQVNGVADALDRRDPEGVLLALIDQFERNNAQAAAHQPNIATRQPNKALGGSGGRGYAVAPSTSPGVPEHVMRNLAKYGVKSPEALKAFVEASGGMYE